MRLLLDTSVFIWAVNDRKRLSSRAAKALQDPRNDLILSHASIWEIVIKTQTGKLNDVFTEREIEHQCRLLQMDLVLPIDLEHIYYLRTLPLHHHDPFDRLLIAQAKVEGLRMVTSDSTISDNYLPDAIW